MTRDNFTNLHVSMTPFTHESRVLKETKTIVEKTEVDHILIAALHQDNLLEEEIIDQNRTINRFILNTRFLPKNLIFQPLKYIEFLFRLVLAYRTKNIHIVNIHTLALLPIGVILKYFLKCKLVYDTHELETETLNLKGIRKRLSKFLENLLISYCDEIICVNISISDWYYKKYNLDTYPTTLINSPEYWQHKNKRNYFRNIFSIEEGKKICLFQGNLAKGRSIEELVFTFKNYDLRNYCLVFLGNGQLSEWIKGEAEIHKNIFYHPAVDSKILLDYTSSADIGFNLTDYKCLNHIYSLPNKFFEYASAGLTILCSSNVEFKRFVDEYECGICISEITPEKINDCLVSLSAKQCERYSQNARKMFELNCWDNQEVKLVTLYNKLLS